MKKGFTLIEILVVIVIIGILAAVAVPKMLGVLDKAKAAEVMTAAGSYIKLQEVYFSTGQNNSGRFSYGSWDAIGYKPPGIDSGSAAGRDIYVSSAFEYTGEYNATAGSKGVYDSSEKTAWGVRSKVRLNDCPNSAIVWEIKPKINALSETGTYQVEAFYKSGRESCEWLTPTFAQLSVGSSS